MFNILKIIERSIIILTKTRIEINFNDIDKNKKKIFDNRNE